MISNSSIHLGQISQQQSSLMDLRSSQVRIQNEPSTPTTEPGSAERRELVLSRDARYRYRNQERLQFANTSIVRDGSGNTQLSASATVAEEAASLLLEGREALRVSRSAMGGSFEGQGHEAGASVRMQANRFTFVSESQSRQVAATGSIEMEDGREVSFTLGINQAQSRQYAVNESVRIEEQAMTDPLVINFGADSAELRDTVFDFDLNGNGRTNQYGTLAAGSGYLALDRNNNGRVDNGSELFGPASGSGFSELAKLDQDGNQWIDRNDPVFDRLKVMVQDGNGDSSLRSLSETGVKALYTGSIRDRFSLVSSEGIPLGEIQATGLYLSDGGEVRTLEELDLARQGETQPPETETVLARSAPGPASNGPNGTQESGMSDAARDRIETIRQALDKLEAIRDQQAAFVERSQSLGQGGETDLDRFLAQMDKLRVALLEDAMKRRDAANEYARGYELKED